MRNVGYRKKGSEYIDYGIPDAQLRTKAVRGGSMMVTARLANNLIQISSTMILARLLTPDDFGIVAMVSAFSLLLYNVGFNGFTEAIIQAEKIDHNKISNLFWIGLAVSSGLAVIFAICSPLLATFFNEPRLIGIALAFSGGFIFSALATEHLALIMRKMEFSKIVVNDIVSVVISTAMAIAMAIGGYGYWAIVARQLVLPITATALAWVQCPWRPGRPVRKAGTRPMIRFAISTFGNFATNYFGRNLDKILLGWKWGSKELGNYDRAYRLYSLPADQMISPLSSVALATLSRLKMDKDMYRRYFFKSLSLIAFVGMFVSVLLTLTGQDIIIMLLGKQWLKAGEIFSAFGPSIGMTLIYGTHGWLHLSLGTPGRWFKWGIMALVISATMFGIALPYKGLGIAIAYGLSFFVLTGPAMQYAGKPMGIKAKDIWRVIWKHLTAAAISMIVIWSITRRMTIFGVWYREIGPFLRSAITSVASTLLYTLAVIVLHKGPAPIRDLISVMKEMLPRSNSSSSERAQ
jgi:O-antigen/teichoic acid export membrane protein